MLKLTHFKILNKSCKNKKNQAINIIVTLFQFESYIQKLNSIYRISNSYRISNRSYLE